MHWSLRYPICWRGFCGFIFYKKQLLLIKTLFNHLPLSKKYINIKKKKTCESESWVPQGFTKVGIYRLKVEIRSTVFSSPHAMRTPPAKSPRREWTGRIPSRRWIGHRLMKFLLGGFISYHGDIELQLPLPRWQRPLPCGYRKRTRSRVNGGGFLLHMAGHADSSTGGRSTTSKTPAEWQRSPALAATGSINMMTKGADDGHAGDEISSGP